MAEPIPVETCVVLASYDFFSTFGNATVYTRDMLIQAPSDTRGFLNALSLASFFFQL